MEYRTSSVNSSSRAPRILLLGDCGVGKTTFVNSLNATLRNGITNGIDNLSSPQGKGNSIYDGSGRFSTSGSSSHSQQPPPSTIGVLCDAISIKYGGAVKTLEVVEVGGNRTFHLNTRQMVYRGNPRPAAVFLFYRPDSPESIVALEHWYEEVKREIISNISSNPQQLNDNAVGGGPSSCPPMSFYCGGGSAAGGGDVSSSSYFSSPSASRSNNNSLPMPSPYYVNGGGGGSASPTPATMGNNFATAPLGVKIVLVAIVNPKSQASFQRGSYAYATTGGGYMYSHDERTGGGGRLASAASNFTEPTLLFRNTGVEPIGRKINLIARYIWHFTMLLLSIILLGPGQTVVPLRPSLNPQEIIRTIESDPCYSQTLSLEFATDKANSICFGDMLDEVVQLLVTLSVD